MDLFSLAAKLSLDSSDYTKGIGNAEGMLSRVGESAKKIGVAMGATLTAAATAVVGLTKQAVEAYKEFEQLKGGVETLFKGSADQVMENAEKAFETAGMSANEYMETVTSFSAALLQSTGRGAQTDLAALQESLDEEYNITKRSLEDQYDERKAFWDYEIKNAKGKNKKEILERQRDEELKALKRQNEDTLAEMKKHNKEALAEAEAANNSSVQTEESIARAAELADMAVIDMSDNANKMGTDISAIQNAYSGFAKQNYTMLDNLKLGYGGTKEEMQRLLNDAEKLTGKKYDLSSYADIVEAIHAIQEEMGIAGTTSEEAGSTIEGSAKAMKAAWQNMLVTLADKKGDTKKATSNLVRTAKTFYKNISPVVTQAISGIGDFLSEVAPLIGEELPGIIADILPKLFEAGKKLIGGLAKGVINAIKKVKWPTWQDVKDAITRAWNTIVNAVSDLGGLIFGRDSEGKVKWPKWEDITKAASDLWGKIKEYAADLAGLIFGKNEDGTVNYPVWDDGQGGGVKGAIEGAWKKICEEAEKLVGFKFGDITSVSDAITKIWGAWQELKTNIEQHVINFVTSFFGDSVDPETVRSAVEGIGNALEAIGAALITYFTVKKVQGIIDFFTNLKATLSAGIGSNKIGLILAAIAAAITLIVENWDKIEPALHEFGTWFDENIFSPVQEFFEGLKQGIRELGAHFGLDTSGWFGGERQEIIPSGTGTEIPAGYSAAHLDKEQVDSLAALRNLIKEKPDAKFVGSDGEMRSGADEFKRVFEETLKAAGFDDTIIKQFSQGLDLLTDDGFVDLMTTLRNAEGYYDENGKKIDGMSAGVQIATSSVGTLADAAENAAGELNNIKAPDAPGHAAGNWNIPYDDYLANLHRGEMVLTASQARQYRDGGTNGIDMTSLFNSIVDAVKDGLANAQVNAYMDGRLVTRETNRVNGNALLAGRFRP